MRIVQPVIACALLLALSGCTVAPGKPVHSWRQATGGEQLERLFWKDLQARNWTSLERHMAAEWVFLTPAGPLDRDATLEHMKKLEVKDYTLGEFVVRPSGTDVIVTYTIRLRGSFDGRPLAATPIRMMTIWQQGKQSWEAIAHADVP